MTDHAPIQLSLSAELPRRPTRGIRAGWLLFLVACIPLSGLIAAAYVSITAAEARRADAQELEQTAARAVRLTEIDGALFDEMVWDVVGEAGDMIGFPIEMLGLLFGTDPVDEHAAASEATDRLLAGDDVGHLRTDVDEVRSLATDLGGLLAAYGTLRSDVRVELADALRSLDDAAGTTEAGDELRDAVELLEAGIALRGAVADAYYGYFASVFDIRDAPEIEIERLIETRAAHRTAIEGIFRHVGPTSDLDIDRVISDPALTEFAAAIDSLIQRSITAGVPERATELTMELVLADVDGLSATYRAATRATSATFELLEASSERVVDATEQVASETERTVTLSYLIVGALIAATVVAALVATQFLVRPLRKLQAAVDQLHHGTLDPADVSATGPAEVRAAADTIRETGEHFTHVTSQVRALAAGDLDADVLRTRGDGGLGDAVQDAVDRLRLALSQQEEFRRRLSHEASHDGLTQIPNRNASMAQIARSLARARRSDVRIAVLFVDLDHFKDVNDHHGHPAGDVVLSSIAHRLVNASRAGDFVGRLGGDEFVVLAEPVDGIDDAVMLAQRLRSALALPIEFGDGTVVVDASVGIALADAHHLTADELLRDADLAVYRAKASGRGGIEICDEDLRRQVAESADLTDAIRRAIDGDEFVMHYQPVVRTADRSVASYEALIRWHRPGTDEVVPPGRFIDFAERSSLIVDIDRWVIDAVARQLASWQDDPGLARTPVAVNLSGRHLLHDDVVEHVIRPLRNHGVDPELLIVELTESVLLDELQTAADRLTRLRAHGVRIAIDDFGTGYTSLAHLRSLPIDILKIDRTFTANAAVDASEASMVKLIVDAGHLLGATVTAEGIETADEARRLTDLGSDSLQGYYFARPQPADALASIAVAT